MKTVGSTLFRLETQSLEHILSWQQAPAGWGVTIEMNQQENHDAAAPTAGIVP